MESRAEMIPFYLLRCQDSLAEDSVFKTRRNKEIGNSGPGSSIQNTCTLNQDLEIDFVYDEKSSQRKEEIMVKKPTHTPLPDDIMYNILLRLPVKTLINFLSVSKSCYSIISLPSFKLDHYLLQTQLDPLLLLMRYDKFDEVSATTTLHLSTHDSNRGTPINNFSLTLPQADFCLPLSVQSCQGLLSICDTYDETVFICNPATRQIIALPFTPNDNVGFGYAASTNEFKVVGFFDPDQTETKCYCKVFTLGTSGWREAKSPPYQGSYSYKPPFLHGALHLLPLPLPRMRSLDDCIYAFHIQTEDYTSIPLPDSYLSLCSRKNFKFVHLTDFGGTLCLNFEFRGALELWLLKDYDNGEWVKEFTIDLTSLGSNVLGEALVSMGDGSILLNVDFGMYNESLYSYNPKDKTLTLQAEGRYSATLHVESFLSPQDLG